jgi:RimJ/RimL family protein N-acetyltransferase
VTKVVTYLEMTDPSWLNPGTDVPGLILTAADERLPLVAELMTRVGAPYGWRSTSRGPEEWEQWFAEHPERSYRVLALRDEPVGIVCYEPHPGSEVEIKTFGLLPEFTGKGLGGHALTLAIRQGWELRPNTRRLWLHTSSEDNPHALANYHRRGLRTFKTEEEGS